MSTLSVASFPKKNEAQKFDNQSYESSKGLMLSRWKGVQLDYYGYGKLEIIVIFFKVFQVNIWYSVKLLIV